jgi:hypothetical protein
MRCRHHLQWSTMRRSVGNIATPFRHQLLVLPKAQRIGAMPAHAYQHHVPYRVRPSGHISQFSCHRHWGRLIHAAVFGRLLLRYSPIVCASEQTKILPRSNLKARQNPLHFAGGDCAGPLSIEGAFAAVRHHRIELEQTIDTTTSHVAPGRWRDTGPDLRLWRRHQSGCKPGDTGRRRSEPLCAPGGPTRAGAGVSPAASCGSRLRTYP